MQGRSNVVSNILLISTNGSVMDDFYLLCILVISSKTDTVQIRYSLAVRMFINYIVHVLKISRRLILFIRRMDMD